MKDRNLSKKFLMHIEGEKKQTWQKKRKQTQLN